jgi:oxygen-independent coproporphyrinogen-3 oxidase
VEALCQEIENRSASLSDHTLQTIYFGGGTPSMLDPGQIQQILQTLSNHFEIAPEAEITLEANPGTVEEPSLQALRLLQPVSINRLSLGVQSFNDTILKAIGRIHSADQAREVIGMARQAGFDNLSIDLIFALPDQTLKIWQETLDEALNLRPEHISLYGLTIEPGTVFMERNLRGELRLPEEEDELTMYEMAISTLTSAGYEQYEISNFALPGRRSAHNQVYWRNDPSIGFGSAAASYLNGIRFVNLSDPSEYIEAIRSGRDPIGSREKLTGKAEMGETLYVGLRMLEGVPFERFQKRFGRDLRQIYSEEIRELTGLGLVELDSQRIRLTHAGLLVANQVFERFLA